MKYLSGATCAVHMRCGADTAAMSCSAMDTFMFWLPCDCTIFLLCCMTSSKQHSCSAAICVTLKGSLCHC
jgi:hypothetical protein